MQRAIAAAIVALGFAALPHAARAWGSTGHRTINYVAMRTLPGDMPGFLTLPQTQIIVRDLGPELDRLKGAGYSFDNDGDPAHFLYLGDDGRIGGIVGLSALPLDMPEYGAAIAPAGMDPYKGGYLPWAIADGWERLREDFAYRRVYDYMAKHTRGALRDTYSLERNLIDKIILADIGLWGHFVGDASQPLHTSIHFNDGGVNIPFETDFVRAHVTFDAVQRLVPAEGPRPASALIGQRALMDDIGRYIAQTHRYVDDVYAISRRGGFRNATPEAVAFADARVAAGAAELRDLIAQAYYNSLYASVGTPSVRVQDVLSGKVVPTEESLRDN